VRGVLQTLSYTYYGVKFKSVGINSSPAFERRGVLDTPVTKISYIHDYFHVKIVTNSPLYQYMENLKLFFENVKEVAPILEEYIPMMYHFTYLLALNVNAKEMARFEAQPVMELSSIFEKAFANLSKINEADKQDYVDRLLFKRVLYDDKRPYLEEFFSDVFKKYSIEG